MVKRGESAVFMEQFGYVTWRFEACLGKGDTKRKVANITAFNSNKDDRLLFQSTGTGFVQGYCCDLAALWGMVAARRDS